MEHLRTLLILALMAALGSACGTESDETGASNELASANEVEGTAAEEASAEEAEAPAEEAPPEEPPSEEVADDTATGDSVTLLALREGFASEQAAWMGRELTVTAQFMSASSVNGSLNNVSLVVSQEDYQENRLAHSMMCAFGDNAPESVDHRQYTEIRVRGTVVERFGRASLDDCQILP
ncbi:MAG: hypothetical protein AB8I08_28860 [Sandaracinaceae bacterium]